MDQTLKARMLNIQAGFSAADRRVADTIIAMPGKVIDMTISELSAEAKVAASGIVRFCHKLGYKGFRHLKISLAGQTEAVSDIIMPAVNLDDDSGTVFEKVFHSGIKTLRDTLTLMDRHAVACAVKMLHEAARIEFYGVGTSATIATDAYFRLMRIGYPAGAVTDSQIMRISAANSGPGQVAVGISHSGRAAETIDAMRLAKGQGAGTIVITSHQDSPICKYADLVLNVYSDESRYPVEAVSARLAHIAVLDALCVALALQNSGRTTQYVHKMNQLFQEIRKQEDESHVSKTVLREN